MLNLLGLCSAGQFFSHFYCFLGHLGHFKQPFPTNIAFLSRGLKKKFCALSTIPACAVDENVQMTLIVIVIHMY